MKEKFDPVLTLDEVLKHPKSLVLLWQSNYYEILYVEDPSSLLWFSC